MRRWTTPLSLTWIVIVLSVTAVIAQETCSELLERALSAVDENCDALERNNACYGFNLVEAAFAEEVAEGFFAEPADIASIVDLETIATAALDEENETWGVAVMNIQANVPNTLPGQSVTFVLMGDTQIANAVAADEAFQPAEGIEVTVNAGQGANVRSGPGLNFNVIGVIADNTTIPADARSEDGAWFRIPYNDRVAWINEVVLEDTSALGDLPVITPELRTSMQAFYLRTGIGQTSCEAAPDDVLLIQGPENIEIELTINGANVVLGSTIGVHTLTIDDEQFLEVITYDGDVEVDGVRVPPGYRTRLCLEETDELTELNVTCEPSTPEPVDDFGADWCVLEDVPANILNYEIEVLCPGETAPPPASTHEPAATTEPASEPEETTEPPTTSPGNTSLLAEVDCSTFRLVGPFSNITPRPTLFIWTPAPGATDYEIVFYNVGDNVVAGTFFTQETSIGVHVSEVPTGGTLAWEVRAYRNGQYACVTSRTPPIMRSIDPEDLAGANQAVFNAFLSCSTTGAAEFPDWIATVTWTGANPTDTVTATGEPIRGTGPVSASGMGEAGSLQLQGNLNGIQNVAVSTSSGSSMSLGQCP